MKIRNKILFFPGLFIIILFAVFLIAYSTNVKSKYFLNRLENGYIPYQEVSIMLQTDLDNLQRGMQDAVSSADEDKLEETIEIYTLVEQHLDTLSENIIGKELTDLDSIKSQIGDYYLLAKEVSGAMIRGDFSEELGVKIQTMVNQFNGIKAWMQNVIDDSKIQSSQAFSLATNNLKSSARNIIIILAVSLVVFLFVSYFIATSLVGSIQEVSNKLISLSKGVLNIKDSHIDVNRNDEIGIMMKATDKLVENLRSIIVDVKSGVGTMVDSSGENSNIAETLSTSANEQAASVEEVSSTMEEIASNIQQNTENAQQTEKIAISAKEGIEKVSKRSQETVVANRRIAEKIEIVNDIAFQTNILALNAAVEAARAGEHGRGFAVVASEVRKLAERSKDAAGEIVSLAQSSLSLAEDAGAKMEEILPDVSKTALLVQEISAASIEQNEGVSQVNNAIQQLNNVTIQNASASSQLSSNADNMNKQAGQLNEVIKFFKSEE